MTFSKHLSSAQVSEWSNAYLNYSLLTKRLAKIIRLAHPRHPIATRHLKSSYGTFTSLLPVSTDAVVAAFKQELGDFVTIFRDELSKVGRFWHAAISTQARVLYELEHQAAFAPTHCPPLSASLIWDLNFSVQTLTDLKHFRHVNRASVIKILCRWSQLQPDLTTALLTHPSWIKLMDWMYDSTIDTLIQRANQLSARLQPASIVVVEGARDAQYGKTLSCPIDVPNYLSIWWYGFVTGIVVVSAVHVAMIALMMML